MAKGVKLCHAEEEQAVVAAATSAEEEAVGEAARQAETPRVTAALWFFGFSAEGITYRSA